MLSLTLTLTLTATPAASATTNSHAAESLALRAPTMKLAQAGYNTTTPTSPPPEMAPASGPAASGTAATPVATAPAPATAYAPVATGAAPEHRGLSLWVGLPYAYGGFGFGIGARFALPLPIPSLLHHPRIHDNWALEFGGDFYRYSIDYGFIGSNYNYSVNWLLPVCGIMWNVWLNEKFAVYPKAEAGYEIAWVSGTQDGYTSPGYGGIYVAGAAGLIYKVSDTFTLRAEAGSFGLKGGVGFVF